MGWTALTAPAQDAAEQQGSGRRKRLEPPQLPPAQWLAVAAVATGVLWAFSKLVLRRGGPTRERSSKAESLPTHVLVNSKGVEVYINPIGCAIEKLVIPDSKGRFADVVLGFDTAQSYLNNEHYFGVVVGRCANRIANATFSIDGKQYKLGANDGQHALHGGGPKLGWGAQVWDAEKTTYEGSPAVRLTYTSRSGEQGYPGTVRAAVTYVLRDGLSRTEAGHLRVVMEATTDKATPVNMAQHSYWNLAGHASRDILGHSLTINADHYTPVDDTAIPTGDLESVRGGPFDFVKPKKIGARIQELPGGYDHNFVLKSSASRSDPRLRLAAVLQDPASGRALEIATSAPGLQFYSGNFLDGTTIGKGGAAYGKHAGVALETQAFPDSINQPQFPSVVLQPDSTYQHELLYTFRTK